MGCPRCVPVHSKCFDVLVALDINDSMAEWHISEKSAFANTRNILPHPALVIHALILSINDIVVPLLISSCLQSEPQDGSDRQTQPTYNKPK